MNIDDMKLGDLKQIAAMFTSSEKTQKEHPMLGKRCLVRTYSAGVHIGDVVSSALLESNHFNGHRTMFFGLNVGAWETGKIFGSIEAIQQQKGEE